MAEVVSVLQLAKTNIPKQKKPTSISGPRIFMMFPLKNAYSFLLTHPVATMQLLMVKHCT
ncbi:hypothetical protein NTGM5_10151 [Candidatus Nitrotoga sp. M5]|nr:hypothetical protein NTGM5_10151 [Candidatus Nitrotoga sp. M5]